MRLFYLISLSLLCLVFQPQDAVAKSEIAPELIYGEWRAGGKIWHFYNADLSAPEYNPKGFVPNLPQKPHVLIPRKKDDALYDLDEKNIRYRTDHIDPIGYADADNNDEFMIVVGSRDEGGDFFDTTFYPVGRYKNNRIKTGFNDNLWQSTGVKAKYKMPEPSKQAQGDDFYKRISPHFCQEPEPLPVQHSERRKMTFPFIVNFPPDTPYHWLDFKLAVDSKTKEVTMNAEVWSMKRTCRYKYVSRFLGDENISSYEPYISNRFTLKPVDPRYDEDYPEYGEAEGAVQKQTF